MGERTLISWCDHTFNPWVGCMRVSPACDGCYAARLMDERLHRVQFGGPGLGVGTRKLTSEANWIEPFRWNSRAREAGTRPFVFGGSLMDPFDKHVPRAWRQRYFNSMIRATPFLVWLLLTKRPQNIVELAEDAGGLPPNVAIGTTAEDQTRWDLNVPELAAAKEATNPLFAFVSIEPMLSAIDVRKAPVSTSMKRHFAWSRRGHDYFDPIHPQQDRRFKVDWIITGGETDQGRHKARPSHPQWFRDIRDQCAAAGIAYHHKQNGEWAGVDDYASETVESYDIRGLTADGVIRVGKRRAGRLLDGVEHNARPEVRAA